MADPTIILTVGGKVVYSSSLASLHQKLNRIEALILVHGDRNMATFQEVMDKVGTISTCLVAIKADIQRLKQQSGPVTQEQLDALDTAISNVASDAAALDSETSDASVPDNSASSF